MVLKYAFKYYFILLFFDIFKINCISTSLSIKVQAYNLLLLNRDFILFLNSFLLF